MASSVLRQSAAGAGEVRPGVIGGVGMEPIFQGTRRHAQCLLPGGGFQGLKI
jgi:hypothetical protein